MENPYQMKENSTDKYLGQHFKKHWNMSFDYLQTKMIEFIFSPDMKTTTKSYLVDEIALISNIGGGLGLVLGISIFSVVDYILEKLFGQIH